MREEILKGKTAIITGGTRGIGKEMARVFTEAGAHVFVAGRNESAGKALVEQIKEVSFIQTDVSQAADVQNLINQVISETGRLDILVNNAGVQLEKTIEETTEEEWDMVMDSNLKSVFLCSKYAISHMRSQGGGKIINTASIDAYWVEPELGAYCTSKGGVVTLTKSIALDFAKDGITCNCICPGYIETEMTNHYMGLHENPQQARRELEAKHPVNRIGKPKDIAEAALWLASDQTNFITGQALTVDGGLTLGNV